MTLRWPPLLRGALAPALADRLDRFRLAQERMGSGDLPGRIAVVGPTPGEGRSTVTALIALAIAGYSTRSVVVVDIGARGERPPRGGGPTTTALLGTRGPEGDIGELIAGNRPYPVARVVLRRSLAPGGALPVLTPPADLAPGQLETLLARLRQRADVVVLDTPVGPAAPLLSVALTAADHCVLVVRGDGDLRRRVAAGQALVDRAPLGPRRMSVVVVVRGLRIPAAVRTLGLPTTVLRRDESLRRGRLEGISRRTVTAALAAAESTRVRRQDDGRPMG